MQYNRSFIPLAQKLRKNQTDAERKLWQHLRARQLQGHKFRRQFPIGNAILDFYCEENKIAIELDGSQHCTEEGRQADNERARLLQKHGITILRFLDTEVLKNTEGVLESISHTLVTSPSPSPRRRGR